MSDYRHVWLIWSIAFLLVFLLIYALQPQQRATMLRTGLGTALFGLTEPLFVRAYWNPPSLFDLAQRTGFDIESVIFAFSIGGIAAALYNLATRQASRPVVPTGRHRFHRMALALPALVFVTLAFAGWNPIYPALIAMAAGGVGAVLCRPDLTTKTLAGGLLFFGFYAFLMLGLEIGAPGYIEQVWNLPALSGLRIAGIPLEELLFGFAFGLYWANVYEHLSWARPMRVGGQPVTAAGRTSANWN